MTEGTPLLLDSRSPPTTSSSSLSRNYGHQTTSYRHQGGYYPGMRSSNPSRVTIRRKSSTPSSSSSSRRLSSATPSSSRQFSSLTTSSPSRQTTSINLSSNKIWQIVVSLPYRMLCFANPICPPLCGVCCCFTCIRENQYGVMERFGKFERILHPGMHFLKWPMEREAGRIGMRIKQLDCECETKSKDHVILRIHVSIQYQINSTNLFESFYSLSSPNRLLTTHIHDIIRSTLPCKDLDDIFSDQDSIASELHRSLNDSMNEYGFLIHHALITQIRPNEHVKLSMNEMEASKRRKQAMPQKAEAIKIQAVLAAEARAERSYLNGVGVARERGAIATGMKDVAASALDDGGAVSTKCVMELLLLTQYFHVLNDVKGVRTRNNGVADDGAENQSPSSSLFVCHMPETVTQLTATTRECFGSAVSDTATVENLLEL